MNKTEKITVRGARVHNLKNISCDIPKNKLVVITGVSGSGKSSLAFDTIFAEGQRRYVESLSPYARQFLGIMEKPDVDSIEGLSPAISVDQKTSSQNPRSTVGTITEIYDYLRLLYARVGVQHCYNCNQEIKSQSVQEIVDSILNLVDESRNSIKFLVLSPVISNKKGKFDNLISEYIKRGFSRIRLDGEIIDLHSEIEIETNKRHNIEIVVDRISMSFDESKSNEFRLRLTDSIETSLRNSDGEVIIYLLDEKKQLFFSEKNFCSYCKISYPKIEPHSFSFNSPFGACQCCNGLGVIKKVEPSRVFNPKLTINEGAIFPWSRTMDVNSYYLNLLASLGKKLNFNLNTPLNKLSKTQLDAILYGTNFEIETYYESNKFQGSFKKKFEGVIPIIERRFKETESDFVRRELEQYMDSITCDCCRGKRLKKESLAVYIRGMNIYDISTLSILKAFEWSKDLMNVEKKFLKGNKVEIAQPILNEITSRLNFLFTVGLGYLTLSRSARTLSGGEAQRIRLASQIGSGLSGVLYVLDEPSIGLHQRDNDKLLQTLHKLRDLGNSVIVVEHDADTIRQADYIIDMGPGAGIHGGEIIASGEFKDIINSKSSLTSYFLKNIQLVGKNIIRKRKVTSEVISIIGAKANNLKNINTKIPLSKFVCITGVSGSGKSTLVNEILYKSLHNKFNNSKKKVGNVKEVAIPDSLKSVILVDQSPIGRTPRSNPSTYTGFFTDIRELFANTNESKSRGYSPGRFSFNVKGGRCETCKGDGVIKIEMQFLPDIYVKCDSCEGKRYNRETLEVRYKGKNIYEVLEMSVEEGTIFFRNHSRIAKILNILSSVGLGYIKLGQQATTLSGGEAQRIKLASELIKRQTGTNLYIMDEPTTGLHFSDVDKLLQVVHQLVSNGNSVVAIEHNLDVIKTADWVIDLGPEGGENGGEIIFEGTVDDLIKCKDSYTGKYLLKYLNV